MFSATTAAHAQNAGPENFSGTLFSSSAPYAFPADASVTFESNGSISVSVLNQSGVPAIDTVSGNNWYSPNTTGIGNSYWAKATVTSGSTPSGSPVGSWESLASPLSWSISVGSPNESDETTITVQISSSALGTPVVASGSISILAASGDLSPP